MNANFLGWCRHFKPWVGRVVLVAVGFGLVGCGAMVQLLPEQLPVPKTLAIEPKPEGVHGVRMSEVEDERWWQMVNRPQLEAVIETALEVNTDVRLAQQRLNEAGAALGLTQTDKWPVIFAEANYSKNRPTQAGDTPVFGDKNVFDKRRAIVGMVWEIDLWGRLAALERAQQARFMAQTYNLRGVRLSVACAAASLYTRVRVFRLKVKLGEATLKSRQQALDLQAKRLEAGLTSELVFRQVQAEYLAVRGQLPSLREQAASAEHALWQLLAGKEMPVRPLRQEALVPTPFMLLPEELPSELLLRRPDLAAAEQQLLAARADLEAARKAFFPSIGLSGLLGTESASFGDLFSTPADVWAASVDVTQPIFQAGALFFQRDAQIARQNQVILTYEAAIRRAFFEVRDAIVAQRESRERLLIKTQEVESLGVLVKLAQKRVDAGVASQLELLDAQRSYLGAQLDWATAWGTQQDSLLAMVKALGGGFSSHQSF